MKLGASYSAFDGIELLRASIKQIREHVDFIDVQYQEKSWYYDQAKKDDIQELRNLYSEGLIDSLSLFTNFRPVARYQHQAMQAKILETRKRNAGLAKCVSMGCTHFINLDIDEFYRSSEFKKAKEFIDTYKIDTTAVHYMNYVTPTLHRGISPHLVPFIHRITPNSQHSKSQQYFPGVDPTRGVLDDSYKKWIVFESDVIMMHHMEMVRRDLAIKYNATSRYYLERERIPELVKIIESSSKETKIGFKGIIYPGMKSDIPLTKVENEFNIHI